MVLLITNKWDISVDYVVRELRSRGVPFLRLNTEDLPYSDCTVTFPDPSFLLSASGQTVEMVGSLRSVLFRRPGRPFDEGKRTGVPEEVAVQYSVEQWHAFIEGLLGIDNVLWINHPRANDSIECKILQLKRAATIGFTIPRTCITSSRERADEFIQSCHGRAVAKSLSSSLIEYPDRDYFVFTTPVVSLDGVRPAEIGIAPLILQECLEEKTDYRVTVVGRKVHSVRIEAAYGSHVPVDWRTKKSGLRFVPCELPEDVRMRCMRYVSDCGLVFGAIDLAATRGTFYFLEINPNGEWGWLQSSAGLPIAETIVDYLTAGWI